MTYAKIENGALVQYPVSEGDIRLLYPNCSFPTPFVAPDGYELVQQTQFPTVDYTKNISEGAPLLTDGVWTQNWVVTDATPEQIAVLTQQEWVSVRGQRNTQLAESDWWVTRAAETGAIISADQQTYRQALRDITDQADPFNIAWPVAPSIGE